MSIVKWYYEIWPYLHSQPCWPDHFVVQVPLRETYSWEKQNRSGNPVMPAYLSRLCRVAEKRGYVVRQAMNGIFCVEMYFHLQKVKTCRS